MPDDKLDKRWLIGRPGEEDHAERIAGHVLDAAVAMATPDTVGGASGAIGPITPHGGVVWPFREPGANGASAAYADAFLAYYSAGKVAPVSEQDDLSRSLRPLVWGAEAGEGVEVTPVKSGQEPPTDGTVGVVVRGARWGKVDNLIFVPISNGELISDWFKGSRKVNSTIVADHNGKGPDAVLRAGIHGVMVVQDSFTEGAPASMLNGQDDKGPAAPQPPTTTSGAAGDPDAANRSYYNRDTGTGQVYLRPGTSDYTAYIYRSQHTKPPEAEGKGGGSAGKGGRFWDGTGVGHWADVLFADAEQCEDHYLGTRNGVREVGGHIRTDAPFKLPGSKDHDFPLAFTTTNWKKSGMTGRLQTAQIRPDKTGKKWRIQYAVPFTKPGTPTTPGDRVGDPTPEIPIDPTWKIPPGEPGQPGVPFVPPLDDPEDEGGGGGGGGGGGEREIDPRTDPPTTTDPGSEASESSADETIGDEEEISSAEITRGLLMAQLGIIRNAWHTGKITFLEAREKIAEILQQIEELNQQIADEAAGRTGDPTINGAGENEVQRQPAFSPTEIGAPSFHGLPLTCVDVVPNGTRVPQSYDAQQETNTTDPGFQAQFDRAPQGIHHQFIAVQDSAGLPVVSQAANEASGNPRDYGHVIECVLPPDKDMHHGKGTVGNLGISEASNLSQSIWHDTAINQYIGGYPAQVSGQTAIVNGERRYNNGSNTIIESYDSAGALTARDIAINTALRIQNRFTEASAISAQTASGDAINTAVTQSAWVDITSETGVADNVDTINGGQTGQVLNVRAASGHTITFVTGSGNIVLPAGNITNTRTSWVRLCYDGTNWMPVCCG